MLLSAQPQVLRFAFWADLQLGGCISTARRVQSSLYRPYTKNSRLLWFSPTLWRCRRSLKNKSFMINLDLDCDLYYTFNNVKKAKSACLFIKRSSQLLSHTSQFDTGLYSNSWCLKDFNRSRRLNLGREVLEHRSYPPNIAWINHRKGQLPSCNENTKGFEY